MNAVSSDSLIFELASTDVLSCVIPSRRSDFLRNKHKYFEDPDSPLTQAGKLKCEGVFKYGLFRCLKSYYLQPFTSSDPEVRCKGVARVVRDKMTPGDFTTLKTNRSFTSMHLAPTVGGEMSLQLRSKVMTSAVNVKRRMCQVSPRGPTWKQPRAYLSYFSGFCKHTSSEVNMDEVRRHYIEQIKLGRIMTTGQLLRVARKHKAGLSWDELTRLRSQWTPTAFRRKWSNPKAFQTISHPNVGRVQGRHAPNFQLVHVKRVLAKILSPSYLPNANPRLNSYFGACGRRSILHSSARPGKTGIRGMWDFWPSPQVRMVAIRHFSTPLNFLCIRSEWGAVFAVGLRRKKMSEFERAVHDLCVNSPFDRLHTIQADKESSLFSASFQAKVRARHGIRLQFLQNLSKSYRAERSIGTIKRHLKTVMDSQDTTDDPLAQKKWVKFLPMIIKTHNAFPAHGTSFRRDAVNSKNFLDFLDEYHEGEGGATNRDFTLRLNSRSIDSADMLCEKAKGLLFDYTVGDEVLATKVSTKEGKKEIFTKNSVEGGWGREKMVVTRALLRSQVGGAYVRGKDRSGM